MRKLLCGLLLLSGLVGQLFAAEAPPSAARLRTMIRKDHPRLFINRDTLPAFVEYARTVCASDLAKLRREVDSYPDDPVPEFKTDIVRMEDGKMIFLKLVGDTYHVTQGMKRCGGIEAAECAILYRATGEKKYRDKALKYLGILNEFMAISERTRVKAEWYHINRFGGIFAYDWLYDALSPEERAAVLKPIYHHIEFMRTSGVRQNRSGYNTGNYGEKGLWWYAGVAGLGDGIDDAEAEKLFRDGYLHNVKMMDYRDQVSAGTGLLTAITTAYCFGWYPHATNNFLHTLRSAAGVDGTKYWTQPKYYAHFIDFLTIPDPRSPTGLLMYGWGDEFHVNNTCTAGSLYTHLAQILHFYGENPAARRIMAQLPPEYARILGRKSYPFIPYVLTGFKPKAKPAASGPEELAAYFPSYGLMCVRSGTTPDATYASVKAGAKETGHQHFDENSFVIYKKGFQALDTGTRGEALHHWAYYPQTIAHNAILIRMPDEPLPNYWKPANVKPEHGKDLRNDGGQYKQGVAVPFGFDESAFHAATGADATACYVPAKCKEAIRHFVYIRPDYFVVYDRVTSVKPEQEKVFLWHTQNEPVRIGNVWRGEAGGGALFVAPLLPAQAKSTAIGGPGREFWTNGRNFPVGPKTQKQVAARGGKSWLGNWRLEIAAPAEKEVRFLTVMQAADKSVKQMVPAKLVQEGDEDGVRFTTAEGLDCTVKFRRTGRAGGNIKIEKDGKTLLDRPLPGAPEKTAERK